MVAHRSAGEILVIHPGALGDLLEAVPALVALRALRAGTRLALAAQPRLADFLRGAGVADEALSFDGLALETLFGGDSVSPAVKARLARFDRVVSWFGSRADHFADRLRAIVPEALVEPPVPETGPPPTVWEHLLETLAPWGVKAPSPPVLLTPPEAWRAEARLALSRLGRDDRRPLLFVHPGAGGRDKRWPAANFAEVIRRVAGETGCQVLIHQGPADRDAVDQLTRALDLTALSLVEPPLHRLAGVLQEAGAYLGADSGVSHLAAAVGAPSVILFPPATHGRWTPWSPTAVPLAMPENPLEVETVAAVVIERF